MSSSQRPCVGKHNTPINYIIAQRKAEDLYAEVFQEVKV